MVDIHDLHQNFCSVVYNKPCISRNFSGQMIDDLFSMGLRLMLQSSNGVTIIRIVPCRARSTSFSVGVHTLRYSWYPLSPHKNVIFKSAIVEPRVSLHHTRVEYVIVPVWFYTRFQQLSWLFSRAKSA